MSANRDQRKGRQPAGTTQTFNGAASNDNRRGQPQVREDYHFEPRGEKQARQSALIDQNDVTFSIGPAGTGKTYIAIAKAVQALKNGEVDRILLARPAVEAGETIGFLPGGQNDKMAPYMRPLYDELDKVYGPGNWRKFIRDEASNPGGVIEVAPIGTMRGRTFEKTFVILDESQNLKWEELKMALTRLGPGSKIVITGDPDQIDLSPKTDSGLMTMIEKLKAGAVANVAYHAYSSEDVVRHKTVQAIVECLDGKDAPASKPAAPSPR